MHFQTLHLALSLYWLLRLGQPLEQVLGSFRLLGLTLVSAFVASAAELAWSGTLSVGFSGVLYAWAAFMWLAARTHPELGSTMTKGPWIAFLGWLLLCMAMPIPGLDDVANAAHVGGLVHGERAHSQRRF